MIKVINESIEWTDLNGTEQSAAECALDDIKTGRDTEEAVLSACAIYNDANAEMDEDEEADYDTVLSYVKSKLESYTEEVIGYKVMKEQYYNVSYYKNGIFQSILVKADSKDDADKKFRDEMLIEPNGIRALTPSEVDTCKAKNMPIL